MLREKSVHVSPRERRGVGAELSPLIRIQELSTSEIKDLLWEELNARMLGGTDKLRDS